MLRCIKREKECRTDKIFSDLNLNDSILVRRLVLSMDKFMNL